MDWVFGSVFNSYLKEGQPENVWEETKKINSGSEVNPVGAFKFNSEPVNTEIANLNAVWGEYKRGWLPVRLILMKPGLRSMAS